MKKLFFAAITSLFFLQAAAQMPFIDHDLNENISNAYALSIGNAYTAGAFGLAALSYNPAGLAGYKGFGISVNSNIGFASGSVISDDESFTDGAIKDSLRLSNMLNNLSVATGFNIKHIHIGLGATYRKMYDWSRTQNVLLEQQDINYYEYSTIHSYNSSGGVNVLSIGGSIQSFSQFSIGLSYNSVSGSQTYNWYSSTAETSLMYVTKDDFESSSTVASGSIDSIGSISGSFWEYGLKGRLDKFSLGMRFRLPYKMTMENVAYSNSSLVLDTVTYTTPLELNMGLMFQANSDISLYVEYQVRKWSNATFQFSDVPAQNLTPYNLNTFHVGANLAGFRLGAYTKKYLAADASETQEQLSSLVLTTGFPLARSSGFSWNLAGSFEFYNDWEYYAGSVTLKGINYKIGSDIIIHF